MANKPRLELTMNWRSLLAAAALAGAAATTADAGVILSDTFSNGTTSMLDWSGDSVFTSVSSYPGGMGVQGTDYVANTDYGITCYLGTQGCVDLDGSETAGTANPAGVLQSNMTLAAGAYTLTFAISGNQRGGGAETTDVLVGGTQIWTSGSLASGSTWALETVHFTTSGGTLDFVEAGVNDDVGNLLDDVSLSTGVPEPATWALMIAGMATLGGLLRRCSRMTTI